MACIIIRGAGSEAQDPSKSWVVERHENYATHLKKQHGADKTLQIGDYQHGFSTEQLREIGAFVETLPEKEPIFLWLGAHGDIDRNDNFHHIQQDERSRINTIDLLKIISSHGDFYERENLSILIDSCYVMQSLVQNAASGLTQWLHPDTIFTVSAIYPEPQSISFFSSEKLISAEYLRQGNAADFILQQLFDEHLYEAGKIDSAACPLILAQLADRSQYLRSSNSLIDAVNGDAVLGKEAIDFVKTHFVHYRLWDDFCDNVAENNPETLAYFENSFQRMMQCTGNMDEKTTLLHQAYKAYVTETANDPLHLRRRIDDYDSFKKKMCIEDYEQQVDEALAALKTPTTETLKSKLEKLDGVYNTSHADPLRQRVYADLQHTEFLFSDSPEDWASSQEGARSRRRSNSSLQSRMLGLSLGDVNRSGLVVAVAMVQDVINQGHDLNKIFPAFAASVGQGADKPKISVKPSHFAKPLKRGL